MTLASEGTLASLPNLFYDMLDIPLGSTHMTRYEEMNNDGQVVMRGINKS